MINVEKLLYMTAHDLFVPLNVQIELLNKCNMKCKHCYIPSHTSDGLSTEKVISILNELSKIGTLNVTFTGGEIFLRSDILEIIEYARMLHFRVTILTNGSLLNDEIIKKLSSLNITLVGMSLYSLDENVYNNITRTTGNFQKVLNNAKLLSKYNVRTRINCPIMKDNIDFYNVYNFCKCNNFIFKGSTVILPQTNGNNENCDLKLCNDDMVCVNKKLFQLNESLESISFDPLELYPLEMCPSLALTLSIDCFGNVYPCNSLNICVGNIFNNSIKEILESPKLLNIRKLNKSTLKKCHICDLKDYCSRCPAIVYSETNDINGCSSTVLNIAKAYYSYKKGEDKHEL